MPAARVSDSDSLLGPEIPRSSVIPWQAVTARAPGAGAAAERHYDSDGRLSRAGNAATTSEPDHADGTTGISKAHRAYAIRSLISIAFNLKELKLSLSPSPQWPQAACGCRPQAACDLNLTLNIENFIKEKVSEILPLWIILTDAIGRIWHPSQP